MKIQAATGSTPCQRGCRLQGRNSGHAGDSRTDQAAYGPAGEGAEGGEGEATGRGGQLQVRAKVLAERRRAA